MKTALITGASKGIGRAAAFRFAKEGYHIAVNAHTSADALLQLKTEIEQQYPILCLPLLGDVGSPEDVERMFYSFFQHFPHLDVLVNNAGIYHIGLLSDMKIKEWQRLMDTNLNSVFYCCRLAIPSMLARKSGKIINISSVWGNIGASCEVAYSASKGGVNSFTRALAKELAPSSIQVNALACGVIDTQMNQFLTAGERKQLTDEIPASRFGTPEEAAELIYFFANAPAYLTGQILTLDGGWC